MNEMSSSDGGSTVSDSLDTNCLTIYHVNAQSLRNKLDSLRCETVGINIISVVETWLDVNISSVDIKLPGYSQPERRDRTLPDEGLIQHGGIAVYLEDSLAFVRRRLVT